MHRFFLPPEQSKGAALTLTGGEAHHALHVLRLRPGQPLTVLDGAGNELSCEVRDIGKNRLDLRVLDRVSTPAPSCRITLIQALPKGKIIESIIQKATELGAHRIVPLLSERVAIRLQSTEAEAKRQKWQAVAIEAMKQSGAPWLPVVELPITPRALLARGETFDLPLIASLQPGSSHARVYFSAFRKEHGHRPRSACIWVGPEGDFTPEEVQSALDAGSHPIRLGPLILRCETAAVYCLSILNHEIQSPEWDAPKPSQASKPAGSS